jgi:sec-independent protein translocase protein TatB
MFDIGWSELVVIGVVALIAIGPKELPGVLRMVGQWAGKARRMAAEFQGQFNEAMREAEMADLKQQFDDISSAAKDLSPTNLLSSVSRDVEDAMRIEPVMPTTPEPPTAETFAEAEAHQPAPEPRPEPAASPPSLPDAKAS